LNVDQVYILITSPVVEKFSTTGPPDRLGIFEKKLYNVRNKQKTKQFFPSAPPPGFFLRGASRGCLKKSSTSRAKKPFKITPNGEAKLFFFQKKLTKQKKNL